MPKAKASQDATLLKCLCKGGEQQRTSQHKQGQGMLFSHDSHLLVHCRQTYPWQHWYLRFERPRSGCIQSRGNKDFLTWSCRPGAPCVEGSCKQNEVGQAPRQDGATITDERRFCAEQQKWSLSHQMQQHAVIGAPPKMHAAIVALCEKSVDEQRCSTVLRDLARD